MKTRMLIATTALLAFVIAGSLSAGRAEPQKDNQPRKGQLQQPSPRSTATKIPAPGAELDAMDKLDFGDHAGVIAQVDSMMQSMVALRKRAETYSRSFGVLAQAHHGADKREILVMQRMSDSMGMMAEEIKVSLQQYKDMLEGETPTESGSAKAEVQNLKGILDGIARDVEGAVNNLQVLQERLGQG